MRARTAAWASLVVGLLLALLVPGIGLNPGALSPGHASIANDCTACHRLGRGPTVARCTACHAPDSIPSAVRRGALSAERAVLLADLHRDTTASDCLECHREHAGWANGSRTAAFDHGRLTEVRLARCATCHAGARPADGVHEGVTRCAECHRTDAWTPAAFKHDTLDGTLAQRCVNCHAADAPAADGLHDGRPAPCADCHGVTAWQPATIDHDRWWGLDRPHTVRCATCHQSRGGFETYTCTGCHEHAPSRVQAQHADEGIRADLARCARCHRSAWDEGEGGD